MGSFQIEVSHSLGEIEQACWEMMQKASVNRHAGMHHMVVGTVRNGIPEIRTVVLRSVNTDERRIYFHTDSRKEMFNDLAAGNPVTLLLYDQQVRTQIRMQGQAVVHHMDELCKLRWAKTADFSRRCYMQPGVPGLPTDVPELPEVLQDFAYTLEESEEGFRNFAVIECVISDMDWYFTHHKGNRRASFSYKGPELSYSSWLNS